MKDWKEDEHLDVCQNIEFGLKTAYEKHPGLTDMLCINGLENAAIAVKKEFGFARNQQVSVSPETESIVSWCVQIGRERIEKINDLTLKEYLARIDKIKKSVKRHSDYGRRGYYEFIKNYI